MSGWHIFAFGVGAAFALLLILLVPSREVRIVLDPVNLQMEELPAALPDLQERCPEDTIAHLINNQGKLVLHCRYPETP